jgi:mannose-6-phosphate isomerase-like protein (cupin superfamily)
MTGSRLAAVASAARPRSASAFARPNKSTYIPIGTKHRLENPGKVPLHRIEVQSGGYLGEDDIERFQDRYNRR